MKQLVNFADLKNPASGKTYRQENAEMVHNIPLDTLVEVIGWEGSKHTGVRGYVCRHDRDCDQTPLYAISLEKGLREDKYGLELKHLILSAFAHGFAEDGLKIIKRHDEE